MIDLTAEERDAIELLCQTTDTTRGEATWIVLQERPLPDDVDFRRTEKATGLLLEWRWHFDGEHYGGAILIPFPASTAAELQKMSVLRLHAKVTIAAVMAKSIPEISDEVEQLVRRRYGSSYEERHRHH